MEQKCRHGFSLVELSIVLVILGLLTGGILAGQSLIRAAELRSVTSDYQRYVTAAQAFRDKYFQLPGDFDSGTRFWGRMNSNADCVTNSSATTSSNGTCDGNNDRMIWFAGASLSAEPFQTWRQLALAGLIEGNYTGITGSAGTADSVIGTNVPKSRLANAGWSIYPPGGSINYFSSGWNNWYSGDYGNPIMFGAYCTGSITECAAIKPEEAWNIDTKVDDGKPGTGRVLASEPATFSGAAASKCTTSTTTSDFTGTYNLSNATVSCGLRFLKVF